MPSMQAEHDEEMTYARQEQAALKEWERKEEEKRALQREIAAKLKMERNEQLAEKNARKEMVSWQGM